MKYLFLLLIFPIIVSSTLDSDCSYQLYTTSANDYDNRVSNNLVEIDDATKCQAFFTYISDDTNRETFFGAAGTSIGQFNTADFDNIPKGCIVSTGDTKGVAWSMPANTAGTCSDSSYDCIDALCPDCKDPVANNYNSLATEADNENKCRYDYLCPDGTAKIGDVAWVNRADRSYCRTCNSEHALDPAPASGTTCQASACTCVDTYTYTCSGGTAKVGRTVDANDRNSCITCNANYALNPLPGSGNTCDASDCTCVGTFSFTCALGTPKDGYSLVNDNLESCKTCNTDYVLNPTPTSGDQCLANDCSCADDMNNDGVMDTEEYDAHVAACAEEVYYYYDGLSLAAPLEHIDTEAECKAFYDWISVDANREKSTDEGGFGVTTTSSGDYNANMNSAAYPSGCIIKKTSTKDVNWNSATNAGNCGTIFDCVDRLCTKEGCMDTDASNFDSDANRACSSCCTFSYTCANPGGTPKDGVTANKNNRESCKTCGTGYQISPTPNSGSECLVAHCTCGIDANGNGIIDTDEVPGCMDSSLDSEGNPAVNYDASAGANIPTQCYWNYYCNRVGNFFYTNDCGCATEKDQEGCLGKNDMYIYSDPSPTPELDSVWAIQDIECGDNMFVSLGNGEGAFAGETVYTCFSCNGGDVNVGGNTVSRTAQELFLIEFTSKRTYGGKFDHGKCCVNGHHKVCQQLLQSYKNNCNDASKGHDDNIRTCN